MTVGRGDPVRDEEGALTTGIGETHLHGGVVDAVAHDAVVDANEGGVGPRRLGPERSQQPHEGCDEIHPGCAVARAWGSPTT